MKKTLLNPLNFIVLIISILIIFYINYNENFKKPKELNEYIESFCKNNMNETDDHYNYCKDRKPMELTFAVAYENNLDYLGTLFFIIIFIFATVSTFMFNRKIHSGYIKYMLLRSKYNKIIKKEIAYSFINVTYLWTVFYTVLIALTYVSSSDFVGFRFVNVFSVFISCLLFLYFFVSLSLILLKKISDIILYSLVSFFSLISIVLLTDVIGRIIMSINSKTFLHNIISSIFTPLENNMECYFIPSIIVNIIVIIIVFILYEKKEELIIETEK